MISSQYVMEASSICMLLAIQVYLPSRNGKPEPQWCPNEPKQTDHVKDTWPSRPLNELRREIQCHNSTEVDHELHPISTVSV